MYLRSNHVHPCSLAFWKVKEVSLLLLQALFIFRWSMVLAVESVGVSWTVYMALIVPWRRIQMVDPGLAVLIWWIWIFFEMVTLLQFWWETLSLVIFCWMILGGAFLELEFFGVVILWRLGFFILVFLRTVLVFFVLVFLRRILAPMSPLSTSPALQGCNQIEKYILIVNP